MADHSLGDRPPSATFRMDAPLQRDGNFVRNINDLFQDAEDSFTDIQRRGVFIYPGGRGNWDDMQFDTSSFNASVGKEPGTSALIGTYLFKNNTDERVTAQGQMTHSWREGSSLYPHVHWAKTTTGDSGAVRWSMNILTVAPGSVRGVTPIVMAESVSAITDHNVAGEHLITPLGELTMADLPISTILFLELRRDYGHVDDTYNATAELFQFDFHIQLNSLGSSAPFTK